MGRYGTLSFNVHIPKNIEKAEYKRSCTHDSRVGEFWAIWFFRLLHGIER